MSFYVILYEEIFVHFRTVDNIKNTDTYNFLKDRFLDFGEILNVDVNDRNNCSSLLHKIRVLELSLKHKESS